MKLHPSYETEFYVSDVGYLVIKQDCFFDDQKLQFLLSPEQTKVLFDLLPELMEEQQESWTGLIEEDDKDV
jgi:hypothetical protein